LNRTIAKRKKETKKRKRTRILKNSWMTLKQIRSLEKGLSSTRTKRG